MARPARNSRFFKRQGMIQPLKESAHTSFLTLHLNPEKFKKLVQGAKWPVMATRKLGAFRGTRSRDVAPTPPSEDATHKLDPSPELNPPTAFPLSSATNNDIPHGLTPAPNLDSSPAPPAETKRKSALKQASAPSTKRQKHAHILPIPDIQIFTPDDTPATLKMSQAKPKLKLSFSRVGQINADSPVQTPAPESATQRTPSIKLSFKPKTPAPALAPTPVVKKAKTPLTNGNTPSSAKKRKREQAAEDSENELARRAPAPPVRKLTLTAKAPQIQPVAPVIKLKAKGKIPKRALGVGYDSELEERELDPVLLDGFILRMQPGEDCEYIKKHIIEGTIGVHRVNGGADIQIKVFDVQGRRGIMTIRQQKYAIAMVDLPCIVEGMKSWDKKGWIKSIDVSQMMLVLGKCKNDEEAKEYPLPSKVDAKTFQYANGITPPMKDVRRRRFARTKRARIDDIESVERKVNQMLQADAASLSTQYMVYDHDPRLQRMQSDSGSEDYSGSEDDAEGEDEDGEGEEDELATPADYFASHVGAHRENAESTVYPASPANAIGEDELADVEAMFDSDDGEEQATNGQSTHISSTLQIPDEGASSFAVTSTSASPSATAAQTPASVVDAEQSSDEDEDEEANANADETGDDDESDEDDDEAEKEDDEALHRVKEQIEDLKAKIREQEELYRLNTNNILRKKIRAKIDVLEGDVAMMRRTAGLAEEDGDGEGD